MSSTCAGAVAEVCVAAKSATLTIWVGSTFMGISLWLGSCWSRSRHIGLCLRVRHSGARTLLSGENLNRREKLRHVTPIREFRLQIQRYRFVIPAKLDVARSAENIRRMAPKG